MNTLQSKREYELAFILLPNDNKQKDSKLYRGSYNVTLSELQKADTEIEYCMLESLDEVLDLKVGETFKTVADRSQPNSTLVVLRVK